MKEKGDGRFLDSFQGPEKVQLNGVLDNAAMGYDAAAKHLRKSQDPAADAGRMAGRLLHMMVGSAVQSGAAIPQKTSQGALKVLVQDLVEISQKIGVLKVNSQEEVNEALKVALGEAVRTYFNDESALRQGEQPPGPGPAMGPADEPPPPGILESMMGGPNG